MSMFYASEAALVPKNLYDLKKLNFVHTSFHSTVECVAPWPWTPVGLQFPLHTEGDVLGVVTQPGSGGLQTSGKPEDVPRPQVSQLWRGTGRAWSIF